MVIVDCALLATSISSVDIADGDYGVRVFNIKRRRSPRVTRRHKNAKDVVTEREHIRHHIIVSRESTNNI